MNLPVISTFIDPKRVTLTPDRLNALLRTVGELYLADGKPWVIGYSGGKDSTAVLQVIWSALAKLPRASLTKPVHVIASDTLVETPVIVQHLNTTLARIAEGAARVGLPIHTNKVTPAIDDTFWVNLIGRGYPAPYNRFRWCTDRMKIWPATRFIHEQIAQHGEVVLVLGARKSESATRAQVMSGRRMVGEHFSRHCDIANAWVYTPLEDWRTEDVWMYLLNAQAPWGGDNRDLVTMYRNAQAGECPLVVDKTTPSCGNSRFGCWTCTVVERDKSMEAMVDAGEEWLEPMLEFRNFLADTQDPERKRELRDHRRRSGKVQYWGEGENRQIVRGPYKLTFRREILRKLLSTQESVRRLGPNPEEALISHLELLKIRQVWRFEEGDWEDSVPQIFREVTGRPLDCPREDWSGMGGAELKILRDVAAKHRIPDGLLVELFDAERRQHGMNRRSRIYDNIDAVLQKDWRFAHDVPEVIPGDMAHVGGDDEATS
jgi:DNA sulfur modification protein DndC